MALSTTASTTTESTPIQTPATSPTSSVFPDHLVGSIFSFHSDNNMVPLAGEVYMIRDRVNGRIITLRDGKLRVEATPSGFGGWHWTCIKNKEYFGFRSVISAGYIGHDGGGNFRATQKEHNWWEWFQIFPCSDGGYLLATQHWSKWLKIDIEENGKAEYERLVVREEEGKGTIWEFVKV